MNELYVISFQAVISENTGHVDLGARTHVQTDLLALQVFDLADTAPLRRRHAKDVRVRRLERVAMKAGDNLQWHAVGDGGKEGRRAEKRHELLVVDLAVHLLDTTLVDQHLGLEPVLLEQPLLRCDEDRRVVDRRSRPHDDGKTIGRNGGTADDAGGKQYWKNKQFFDHPVLL